MPVNVLQGLSRNLPLDQSKIATARSNIRREKLERRNSNNSSSIHREENSGNEQMAARVGHNMNNWNADNGSVRS